MLCLHLNSRFEILTNSNCQMAVGGHLKSHSNIESLHSIKSELAKLTGSIVGGRMWQYQQTKHYMYLPYYISSAPISVCRNRYYFLFGAGFGPPRTQPKQTGTVAAAHTPPAQALFSLVHEPCCPRAAEVKAKLALPALLVPTVLSTAAVPAGCRLHDDDVRGHAEQTGRNISAC